MKVYSPSRSSKGIGIFLALIPFLFSLVSFVFLFVEIGHLTLSVDDAYVFLSSIASGFLFLVIGGLIIDYNFTKMIIDSNTLIFNHPFLPDTKYNLKELKEISWISLPVSPTNTMIGGSPQATGRAIGNALIGIKNATTKNAYSGRQFLAKMNNGATFSIRTNFINDSNNLIEDIKKISGLEIQTISTREYASWKKGDIKEFRENPEKRITLEEKISVYINTKTIIYIPFLILISSTLIINILFNLAQIEYINIQKKPFSKDFVRFEKNKDWRKGPSVFLHKKIEPVLTNINLSCFNTHLIANKELEFHYSFFPFETSYCLYTLMNLDDDEEPEIIYQKGYSEDVYVYDFDQSTQQFISKPVESFSYPLKFYVISVESFHVMNVKVYIPNMYIVAFRFIPIYLFVAFFILGVFKKLKENAIINK